jgi:uncharacterized repeat protein (TIGR03803 family)
MDERSKKFRFFAFNSQDGYEPLGGVYVDDKNRALYGTTLSGGANGEGTIYAINSAGRESVLYSFCSQNNCTDGNGPWVKPTPDSRGNLYGTTQGGGANNAGAIFSITP